MFHLLDLIFPKICSGCGKWGSYLCNRCVSEIKQGDLICPNCEKAAIGGKTHPLCHKKFGLDGLWSLGVYQNPLRSTIQKLKYKFVTEVGNTLVDLMVGYWAKYTPEFFQDLKKDPEAWVIVPVPLHKKREKFRGFNQSAILGKLLASKMGLKYSEVLKRVRYTKPQVGMDSWERKKNIKNAFSLDPRLLTLDSSILLVDDVWTTGSTLKECCYVLKKGGASKVWATTLAR
ncbi:MAG: ComF family protein [Candidatus Daviesbacteria bacterium]